MGAIICQYQEQLKTRFLPLDDNFLVLIIFAAYSTFVSLCTHRRTMLKAPLREIYGKQKLNRHRKKGSVGFKKYVLSQLFFQFISLVERLFWDLRRTARHVWSPLYYVILFNDWTIVPIDVTWLSRSSTWLPFRLLPIFYSPERGKSIFSDNDI